MKEMLSKLRSRAGESISETLVALLISALALLMLAGSVSSASKIVTKSNKAMNDYYAVEDEGGDAESGEEGEAASEPKNSAWKTAIDGVIK